MLILAAASCASSQDAPLPDRRAREVLEGISKLQRDVAALRADVVQVKRLRILKDELRSKGTLLLARPDKLRFEVTEPERSLLVCDGRRVWTYYPDYNEAEVVSLSELGDLRPLFDALMGAFGGMSAELSERYRVLVYDEGESWRLEFTPDDEVLAKLMKRLSVRLSKKDGMPVETVMEAPGGEVTRSIFSSVEVNPDLPRGSFTFKPPEGASVVRRRVGR